MDKFPVLWDGKTAGELTTEKEQLYSWFDVRCMQRETGIWCAWAVGEQGELRIGILEPQGRELVIRRRFSDRLTQPLGKLLRGEVRPTGEQKTSWKETAAPEMLFRAPWLRRSLQGRAALYRWEGRRLYLALSYDCGQPFPLLPLFCFAKLCRIRGKTYLLFCFNEDQQPVFD